MLKRIIIFCIAFLPSHLIAQSIIGEENIIDNSTLYSPSIMVADLDNDGIIDIMLDGKYDYSGSTRRIEWYKNNGDGDFEESQTILDSSNIRTYNAIDFDSDGDIDIVFNKLYEDLFTWLENDGLANFTTHNIELPLENVYSLRFCDIDSDNDIDIVYDCVTNSNSKILGWIENDGFHNFEEVHIIGNLPHSSYIRNCLDIDNDGDIDVVSYALGQTPYFFWDENEGDGIFVNRNDFQDISDQIKMPYFSDLDNDGDLDLIGNNYSGMYVYLNDGNLNYIVSDTVDSFDYPNIAVIADLDNDGDDDILCYLIDECKLEWVENNGTGKFGEQLFLLNTPCEYISLAIGDIDNDEDNDIILADLNLDRLLWYENLVFDIHNYSYGICSYDSIFLFDQWINEAGLYSYTYINSFGGDSLVHASVEILTKPNNFDIIGLSPVEEYEIQLYSVPQNSNINYSYEVENGNIIAANENSVEIQWGEKGDGEIIIIATLISTGCKTSSHKTVYIGYDGVNDYNNVQIRLFPNPTKNVLYCDSDLPNLSFEIYSTTGQLIKSTQSLEIDLGSFDKGLYFLKVFSNNKTLLLTEKLMLL